MCVSVNCGYGYELWLWLGTFRYGILVYPSHNQKHIIYIYSVAEEDARIAQRVRLECMIRNFEMCHSLLFVSFVSLNNGIMDDQFPKLPKTCGPLQILSPTVCPSPNLGVTNAHGLEELPCLTKKPTSRGLAGNRVKLGPHIIHIQSHWTQIDY